MKQSYEIVETRLLEERLGYERQLQQAERALKQKNASFNELFKLSQSAVKAKEAAERSLSKVQARDGKEISLSSDLQFDLEEPEAPLALIPETQVSIISLKNELCASRLMIRSRLELLSVKLKKRLELVPCLRSWKRPSVMRPLQHNSSKCAKSFKTKLPVCSIDAPI